MAASAELERGLLEENACLLRGMMILGGGGGTKTLRLQF